MSTIIVAVILISAILIICLVLISINNRDRRKTTTALLNNFSKLGTENKLSFSSVEILQHCVIGLDGMKRKLFILKKDVNDGHDTIVVDLNEVRSISTKKLFRRVNIGTEKREKFENQIDKMVLAFDFSDNRQPVHISFFDPAHDHILSMQDLEQKAKNWVTILSKLLNPGLRKIA